MCQFVIRQNSYGKFLSVKEFCRVDEKMFTTMEQLKKLALDKYEEGGHWFVECWEDKDWFEFIDACDRHWRPYDVCLLEMMEAKESYARDVQNA